MGNQNTDKRIKQFGSIDFGLVKIIYQKYHQSNGHITIMVDQTLKLNDGQSRK